MVRTYKFKKNYLYVREKNKTYETCVGVQNIFAFPFDGNNEEMSIQYLIVCPTKDRIKAPEV